MSYHVPHQPQANGAAGHLLDEIMPGFYDRPSVYASKYDPGADESVRILKSIRGKIDATVTVYRAVPDADYGIEEGNWVTLSKQYAELHATQNDGSQWPVVSMQVRAGDIRSPGDSVNEWGYFPSAYGLPIDHELTDAPVLNNSAGELSLDDTASEPDLGGHTL